VSHDEFADVASWSEITATAWADRLDARASAPDQVRLRTEVLRLTGLEDGSRAAEIGCGTGAMLVDLARAVGPHGRVFGVEPQPTLAERARDRVAAAGLAAIVEVLEGDGQRLPLVTASVDATLTQTVLIHLALPMVEATLAEMVRITVPGGVVIAVEQDCDTWTIDHPDRELTRRIVAFNSDQRSADGWRGRQLPRLFADAGLEPHATVYVHADSHANSYLFSLAERIAHAAPTAAAIEPEAATAWLQTLREQADRGRFFSSINYVICSGTRSSRGAR
jgi:ubiquinone/menaquinone biosynthesis C-methylase UbiE